MNGDADLQTMQAEEARVAAKKERLEARIPLLQEKLVKLNERHSILLGQIKRGNLTTIRDEYRRIIADARSKLLVYDKQLDPNAKPDDGNGFKCDWCSKVLSTAHSLKEHTRMHTNKRLKCALCPKQFLRRKALNRHVRTTHNADPHFNAVAV